MRRAALRKEECGQVGTWKKFLKEWVLPLGAEVFVIVFLLKVVFMLVLVPSGSMLPTIQKNSVLFCTYIHDVSKVERGQILVFESDELGKILIKRLIGLPGEKIKITDGKVWINGEEYQSKYTYSAMATGGIAEQEQTLSEDEYFVLCDSRSNTDDSRNSAFGMVKKSQIIGKVSFRLKPFSRVTRPEQKTTQTQEEEN